MAQYQGMLQMFNDKPVTLRTLDVGGDKQLPYMPISEENPCLGWRGIRITLDQPEIFDPGAHAARANAAHAMQHSVADGHQPTKLHEHAA